MISDDTLDPASRVEFAEALNRRYFACGCAEGAIGLTVGVAAAAIALAVGGIDWTSFVLLALPIAGLVIGKAVGLIRAEARLKETIREIGERWPRPKMPAADDWTCG